MEPSFWKGYPCRRDGSPCPRQRWARLARHGEGQAVLAGVRRGLVRRAGHVHGCAKLIPRWNRGSSRRCGVAHEAHGFHDHHVQYGVEVQAGGQVRLSFLRASSSSACCLSRESRAWLAELPGVPVFAGLAGGWRLGIGWDDSGRMLMDWSRSWRSLGESLPSSMTIRHASPGHRPYHRLNPFLGLPLNSNSASHSEDSQTSIGTFRRLWGGPSRLC